ncbi:MAG: PilN domain-containing protein [Chloroflexi bacterium]|nr:PilN domain-containing protein [Chloroflexota bacterium]
MEQRKAYRRVPNFNFIPPEYRMPTISLRRLSFRAVLVLIAVIEILVVQSLYAERSSIKANTDAAQRKTRQIEKRMETVNVNKQEAVKLQATIDALKKYQETTELSQKELGLEQVNWARVMNTFFQSKPEGVTLQRIAKQERQVSITGTAADYATLVNYQKKLLSSSVFSKVVFPRADKSGASVTFSMIAEVKAGGK